MCAPNDPLGQAAAARPILSYFNSQFAGLLASFGADNFSVATALFVFFGQNDNYHFNYLVGALYSVADSGVGLGLGWRGFLIDVSTFTAVEVPLSIRGNTLTIEVSADALGNPASFNFAVGSECDPVPIPDEKNKSVLLVDYAPDHDYATWPAP